MNNSGKKGDNNLTQRIFSVSKHLELSNEDFHKKKRHIFVITDAGKPVYSRYGDESDLAPIVATFNVILHKLKDLTSSGVASTLKKVENDHTKTIIKKYGELFMLYISKEKNDPDIILDTSLDILMHQIVCSITSSFKQRLANSPNYNPGNSLQTHHHTLAWNIAASRHSFSNLFGAYNPFMISSMMRKQIQETLELFKEEGLVYKQLITRNSVIAWDNQDFDLEPEDINCLFHLVNSKFLVEGVDYIMPYCVPSIADTGYINLYFRMITGELGLLIIFSEQQKVKECVQICQKIEMTLEEDNVIESLKKFIGMSPLSPSHFRLAKVEIVIILNLKFKQYMILGEMVYKKKTKEQRRFFNVVAKLYEQYRNFFGKKTDQKNYGGDFEAYEKVDDYLVGVFKEKELLVFARQSPWNDRVELRKQMVNAVQVARSDYHNFFIQY